MTERKDISGQARDTRPLTGEGTGAWQETALVLAPPFYELRVKVAPPASYEGVDVDVAGLAQMAGLRHEAAVVLIERLRAVGEAALSSRTREVAETWAAELNDAFRSKGLPLFCTMRRSEKDVRG